MGDAIIERWDGTSDLGTNVLDGGLMKEPFQERFTKQGGGMYEGLALGSSVDTVRFYVKRIIGGGKCPVTHNRRIVIRTIG